MNTFQLAVSIGIGIVIVVLFLINDSIEKQTEWLKEPDKDGDNQVIGEWQLCPKCNGDGHLYSFNSPNMIANDEAICDVCQGAKIIQKPIQ